jgi:hypothetical protein
MVFKLSCLYQALLVLLSLEIFLLFDSTCTYIVVVFLKRKYVKIHVLCKFNMPVYEDFKFKTLEYFSFIKLNNKNNMNV